MWRYHEPTPYKYTMFDPDFIEKISKRINERSIVEAKLKLWATKAWEETRHLFQEWSNGSFEIRKDNGRSFTIVNSHQTVSNDPNDDFIVKIIMPKDYSAVRVVTKYHSERYEQKDEAAYKERIAFIMLHCDESLIKQYELYIKGKYCERDIRKKNYKNQIKSIINQIDWKRYSMVVWNKIKWTTLKYYHKFSWRKK